MSGGRDQIPVSSKKVIQSIKEIVNFPEDEIYSILKDCNMDPSEAVSRLLNQDSFHEVKSKREKKKEGKDMSDSRSRSNTSSSTRGSKGGTDRYSSRNNSTQFNSSDYATQRGKPVYHKEIEPPVYRNNTFSVAGNNSNSWQTVVSDTSMDKPLSTNATASILPTPQPSGFQSAWSGGMPGQVSMADIVRMGRPRGNTSTNLNVSQQYTNGQHASNVSEVNQNDEWGRDYASNVPEVNQNDEWGRDEEPPDASGSSIVEPPVDSEPYIDQYDITQQQFRSQGVDERYEEDDTLDDEHAAYVEPVSGSNQNLQENNYVSASGFDNNELYQNIDSYQADHHEAEDPNVSVSSITNNFESLSFPKDNEEEDAQSEDGSPAVKIPEHLLVQTANLSHLSFGSFGCGAFAPRPVHANEEEATVDTDSPSAGQLEARNTDYYEEEHRATSSDGNNAPHRMGAGSGNFEAPTVSQTEIFQQEALESAHPNQYSFPSSTADYAYENSQQINSQVSSQMMQGLPSLTSAMSYSDSLPGTMSASNMQPSREAEIAFSQLSQSMVAKYGTSIPSLSDPTASMAELLKASNVSGAAGVPQHFLPPHLALNMMGGIPQGYSYMPSNFLPQGYSYMPPSNFQQPFATGNSAYPQSGGYGGGFGNSNTLPNDFPPSNPPSAHPATNMNYDDVFAAQFRDASLHFPPEKAVALRNLMHFNSRTFERQPPPAGFQQRPSVEQYDPPGYHDYYQQHQMLRDGTSQVPQQLKQTQQHLWQNNY